MNDFALFTDVSSHPKLKLGLGAYLILTPILFLKRPDEINQNEVCSNLHFKKFESTSSTKLEVETVLWGIDEFLKLQLDFKATKLSLYTDSQCVDGLLERRSGLEANNFISKGKGTLHKNTELYKQFYSQFDKLGFSVNKVKGHAQSHTHDTIHRIFSYIDNEVRSEFKKWMSEVSKSTNITLNQ